MELKKVNSPKRKDVKTSELVALRIRGLSYERIAQLVGMTKQAVMARIKGCLRALDEDLGVYKENKAVILTAAEKKLIDELISKKKIKKANLSSLAYAFKEVYNANRLEQGLSTQNIAYREILEKKEAIQRRIRELERAITSDDIPESGEDNPQSPE